MWVEDYYQNGKRWWFRLHEKGGKRHEVPAHHSAEAYMDVYLSAAGIGDHRKLTLNPMTRGISKRPRKNRRYVGNAGIQPFRLPKVLIIWDVR